MNFLNLKETLGTSCSTEKLKGIHLDLHDHHFHSDFHVVAVFVDHRGWRYWFCHKRRSVPCFLGFLVLLRHQ